MAPPAAVGSAALAAGDLIEIKFAYAPELNETQSIRPDGFVSLQLIGEVRAAGLTPGELSLLLRDEYAKHLKNPAATVVQRNSLSRRVFVGGEVRLPRPIELPGPLNVFEALTLAGGLDLTTAAVGHVIVMRSDGDRRVGYRVDLRPTLRGEATTPFMLQAGDHVYVPRTAVVNVNQFMRQYVAGVVPRAGVIATRTGQDGTIGLDTSYSGF